MKNCRLICADVCDGLKALKTASVQCIVTSPPYWSLRSYSGDSTLGTETDLHDYVKKLVDIFRDCRRVLADDGVFWVNIGDTYIQHSGGHRSPLVGKHSNSRGGVPTKLPSRGYKALPHKSCAAIPFRLAIALQEDGWLFRDTVIWHKPNPIPMSLKDRTTLAHEYLFMFSKQSKYYYDYESIMEQAVYAGIPRGGSRNRYEQNSGNLNGKMYEKRRKRSVWTVRPHCERKKDGDVKHYAVYPPDLIRPCILSGSRKGDVVLDPFVGSGTTALVALQEGRKAIGIDASREYIDLSRSRLEAFFNKAGNK